jgi:hypothetical protein
MRARSAHLASAVTHPLIKPCSHTHAHARAARAPFLSAQAMLAEDAAAVRALSSELTSLEAHFASADPPTARFLRVLLALLAHDEPALPDMARLRPDYAASFERIFALIGDAGWAVRLSGANALRACVCVRRGSCGCVCLGFVRVR